jgi:predicted HD phosphohydrolase
VDRRVDERENGAVFPSVDLTLEQIVDLLALGEDRLVEVGPIGAGGGGDVGGVLGHTQLEHALQTAAVLRDWHPDDDELAVAGLVHDIGHLLDAVGVAGVGDAEHAAAGGAAVRAALGERVATLVGLHVEAKRYLVADEGGYGGTLAADSVASLALQGGAMTAGERRAFEALPLSAEAVVLRRADESGKVEGLVVDDLGEWVPVLERLYAHDA